MVSECQYIERGKKKLREIERELNTPLYLLRCVQIHLSIKDLSELDVGMVLDMMTEQQNDDYNWPYKATQEDFDRF